jgi:hypothetical protein
MGGGGNKVEETAAQKAMMTFAVNQFADYKQRWLPVQKHLADTIIKSGAPDSAARDLARGKTSTDNAIAFSRSAGVLEKSLANAGAAPGSSRANLAVTGMGEDQARSGGLGLMVADQQIDDAYTQGLAALTQIGRGERAGVANSLADQARTSAGQAAADAQASLNERAGYAEMAGQFAGYGLQQAMKTPVIGTDKLGKGGGYIPLGSE